MANVVGTLTVTGFVTQYRFLAGHDLHYIELALGYQTARLATGATFVALDRLPRADEFETRGYSQVAGHRYRSPGGLDMNKIKLMAMGAWSLTGPNQLIKVWPTSAHNPSLTDDAQYPPGLGIPQWKLTGRIPGHVVATLSAGSEVFRVAGI